MDIMERKQAFIALGKSIAGLLENMGSESGIDFKQRMSGAQQKNQWFTPASIVQSFTAISSWLKPEPLNNWLQQYSQKLNGNTTAKEIGVIMAGNIPMVGFHDLLCVLISGNSIQAKCASDDAVLLPFVCELLQQIEPKFKSLIRFTERLDKPEAVIATGGNNSARYFEYYFGKKPHIIRKNRNGVAVLNGTESKAELENLGDDIFNYFGLGCRNVSKLYVPENYDFSAFFKAMERHAVVMQHNKYMNNYDYHNTLFLLNGEKFLTNNYLIIRENNIIATPVSVVHYEFYQDHHKLLQILQDEKEKIQCIIGKGFIPFGKSQSPSLNDYADRIDVMQFLIDL